MKISLWRGFALSLATGAGLFCGTQTCEAQYAPGGYVRNYGYTTGYGGGYGGYGGGMTQQMGAGIGTGAAATGLGNAAVDAGQYQIEHQQANMLQLQAYQEYLKTLGMQHDYYLQQQQQQQNEVQMKEAAARQQVEAYKRDMSNKAAPHRLSEDQFDQKNNMIHWPMVLRDSMFDEDRYTLDQLFHQRTPDNSGADSDNCAAVEKACDSMLKDVGKDINNLNIDQFITAKHFITSLAYEAKFKEQQ
ncbi:hypothetical protein [Planctomicrobium piriforme]|uniref:Uncharacterized protein n=1 Tax=Planctomicrobium piriforme TaxID=1576369 RepID=A0A1I3F8U9_9PLAN|nr:hypothetical protein [Planctomicrobium piriforme]SFI07623.1 hypothetical protein SAMN05421753_105131 [Planctomicrobium piriforme]